MLFSRVFNWIKYKTLPPSFLFLNRLFVERDSKHRRVTSNLGLTFRNSKWSSYARTNINVTSKIKYIKVLLYVLLSIFTILLLLKSSKYSTVIVTPLWFLLDADIYIKVVFSSLTLCSIQLLLTQSYNWLVNTIIGTNSTTQQSNSLVNCSTVTVPKRLFKPILYKWLTAKNNHNSWILVPMSHTPTNRSSINTYGPLFQSMYSLTYAIRQVEINKTQLSNLITTWDLKSLLFFYKLSSVSVPSDSTALLLDYWLVKSKQNLTQPTLTEFDKWTLTSINKELLNSQTVNKVRRGLIYVSNMDYLDLNRLSATNYLNSIVKNSIENQLNLIRWNRWLYKYNILHRNSLRSAEYLTITKRLLGSGFYSNSLLTRNIWAGSTFSNEFLNKTNVNNPLASIFSTLYSDYRLNRFSKPLYLEVNTLYENSTGVHNLSYYENSYHWFIKRFYNLNTLYRNNVKNNSQLISTSKLYSANPFTLTNDRRFEFETNFSHFTISSNVFSNSLETTNNLEQTLSTHINTGYRTLHLDYSSYSYLTKSRIEIMHNLLRNKTSHTVKFFTNNIKLTEVNR